MNGALLVDKPAGPTSHDVVQQVRRLYGVRSVGHTGTLDPFATGLLVVLLGNTTRLARFVESREKTYLATARLGVQTDTDDATGKVLEERPVDLTVEAVTEAVAGFLGEQEQRPPIFSAKKVGGKRSHKLARKGQAVELKPVPITVHAIDVVAYEAPDLTFRTTVSAGTYIRGLARDLGERLGVGGHLTALRREKIGDLSVSSAIAADALTRETPLRSTRELLRHLPQLALEPHQWDAIAHGRAVRLAAADAESAALLYGDAVVGIATVQDGWAQPSVVLATPSGELPAIDEEADAS